MDDRYEIWIEAHYRSAESALGCCEEATRAMVRAFPELRRVKGHYDCPLWGRRMHWWCETPGGEVTDPTRAQFPTRGLAGTYEEASPETLVRTGACMQCGRDILVPLAEAERGARGGTFCSEECELTCVREMEG